MRAGQGYDADLAETLAFSSTRPQEEQPLDPGGVPVQGVGSRSAEVCGACHRAIYQEWQVSTHRHAWNDPQFQAEIKKSGNTWLCRNCHTPTLEQQPLWPVGLTDDDVEAPILVENPQHDATLMDQGITCVACHVRQGKIHGPGLPDSQAPHPVEVDAQYRNADLCLRCHQAVRTYPGKGFVCTFNTGAEWRESPQAEAGQSCVDCHMPAVERPAAVGGPVRTVRRHWFKGSGIAKFADAAPPQGAPPGPGLALSARRDGDHLRLELHNANAGHTLPSGDPERWIQIETRFETADGAPIGDPDIQRIGQTWEWHPVPKKTADNRLWPDERRTLSVAWPGAASRAEITASSHRISKKNADYHNLGDYPRSIRTHRISVPSAP